MARSFIRAALTTSVLLAVAFVAVELLFPLHYWGVTIERVFAVFGVLIFITTWDRAYAENRATNAKRESDRQLWERENPGWDYDTGSISLPS